MERVPGHPPVNSGMIGSYGMKGGGKKKHKRGRRGKRGGKKR